jgi:DnaJ-class molecular chaperone
MTFVCVFLHPAHANLTIKCTFTHSVLNDAYTVLSDPELRAQYDAGQNVNPRNAKSRNGGGGFKFNFESEEPDEDGQYKAWFTNDEGEREETVGNAHFCLLYNSHRPHTR